MRPAFWHSSRAHNSLNAALIQKADTELTFCNTVQKRLLFVGQPVEKILALKLLYLDLPYTESGTIRHDTEPEFNMD